MFRVGSAHCNRGSEVGGLSFAGRIPFRFLQLGIVEVLRICTWKSRRNGESHFRLLKEEKLRFQPSQEK